MKKLIIGCVLLAVTAAFSIFVIDWHIAKGTKTNFTVAGLLGVNVHGTLDIDASVVKFDPADLKGSSVSVTLKVNSINTGINARDKHLKSADYFDAEKYPDIIFASTGFSTGDAGQYIVNGNLTIKGTTKKISIPFNFVQTGNAAEFNGKFTLNRLDYSVGKQGSGTGKTVKIELKIPATK